MGRTKIEPDGKALPGWVVATVLAGAMLLTAGGVIALVKPGMLVSPTDVISGAVKTYAGYLISRNFAVALMLVISLVWRDRRALGTLLMLAGFVQLFDTAMNVSEGRWPLVPGVLVLAILFFAAAVRISERSLWKSAVPQED